MSTQKPSVKLPKGLPKLPPIPNGHSHWKLLGWGMTKQRIGERRIAGSAYKTGDTSWDIAKGRYRGVMTDHFYIVAVKAPTATKRAKAPTVAKSATVPAKKAPAVSPAKPIMAVQGEIAFRVGMPPIVKIESWSGKNCASVAVLDVTDEAALIEQVAKELGESLYKSRWEMMCAINREQSRIFARVSLSSLGVIAKRKNRSA